MNRATVYDLNYKKHTIMVFNIATKYDSPTKSVQSNYDWLPYFSVRIDNQGQYSVYNQNICEYFFK